MSDTSEFLTCLIKKFGGSMNLICSDLAQCQSSNRCCQTAASSIAGKLAGKCKTGRYSTVCKMAAWSETQKQCCTITPASAE